MRLYDLCRPDADPTCLSATGYTSRIKKLVWAPDGRTLYMGRDDGMLRVWDVASGAIVREIGGLTARECWASLPSRPCPISGMSVAPLACFRQWRVSHSFLTLSPAPPP